MSPFSFPESLSIAYLRDLSDSEAAETAKKPRGGGGLEVPGSKKERAKAKKQGVAAASSAGETGGLENALFPAQNRDILSSLRLSIYASKHNTEETSKASKEAARWGGARVG